jgi:hypothetical protein
VGTAHSNLKPSAHRLAGRAIGERVLPMFDSRRMARRGDAMNRSIVTRAAVTLAAAWLAVLFTLGAAAQTQPDSTGRADPGSTFSEAGTNIKKGAVGVGKGIKQGAETVGEKIKNAAVDIWEAGKAAIGAGSRKLDERRSAPPSNE